MGPMMIEAAINESVGKERNPNVPYGVDEVVRDALACARAGATIVHFHARDAATGENRWTDAAMYAEAFRRIQAESDVIVYPSYPPNRPAEERISHILKLAADPSVRMELATWDLGSTNTAGRYDPETRTLDDPARVLVHTHEDVIYFLRTSTSLGIRFSLGLRDPGHLRHALAYVDMGIVPAPMTLKLFFSDFDPYGMPPTAKGLLAYVDFLPPELETHWFVISYGPSHARMNMLAAAMGGHIRTGLGDNPTHAGRQPTNVELVERAAELAERAGRTVATPAEARRMMGITGP